MAGLDIIILIIVIVAAIGGFLRGLVQEVLSLASWIFAALAVHFLHPVLTPALTDLLNSSRLTPVLSFVLLLLIPYAAMKLIAGNISEASDGAILGPIDRVLGLGFGAVKGALIGIFAFSLLALGFDEGWGYKGRPVWIISAQTYPAVDAFSRDLVPMIAIRRDRLRRESDARDAAAARAGS
ncbi:CvpA family protein [Erythrobacter dokdonensis]|jgi:membrane protein required for colicin V production|uniref:Colicin V production protein n=1 Tax=Erythrobacter dokdonensis DSW-74 TaxID=1300349 RepID=A0A1A7BJF2_9SPHN|nr:CvpA family protein [Erythrobacter dokdonensis]OBV12604.1 Colicin V production protein [Erythrobacter dokdonensis DSW-74]